MLQTELKPENLQTFESASRAVLRYLYEHTGLRLWMMTRTEEEDWIVLQAEDHGYDVSEGTVFRWLDSFCSRMVLDIGPRVAPRAQDIPAYRKAPIAKQVTIGAYIGVPVTNDDGSLFGTLCAIDPDSQDNSLQEFQPLVELLASLLGSMLHYERCLVAQTRLLERRTVQAHIDTLTGVLNRTGWEETLATEELHCQSYGSPACIFILDLDGLKPLNDAQGHTAGDELLKATARTLLEVVPDGDFVARVGGDEFAVLAIECKREDASALQQRIESALAAAGISASVGHSMRHPEKGLRDAVRTADEAMYAVKRQRGADQC